MKKKFIFLDILGYIPIKLVPALLGAFLVIGASRSFTQVEYISYSVTFTISLLIMQFGVGWIGTSIVYYFSFIGNKRLFIASASILVFLASIASSLVVLMASYLYSQNHSISIAAACLCFSQSISISALSFCQAQRVISTQIFMIFITSLGIALIVAMMLMGWITKPAGLIYGLAFSYLAPTIYFAFKEKLHLLWINQASFLRLIPLIKKLIVYGAPFSLWTAAALIIISSDKFFIKELPFAGIYLSGKDLIIGMSSLLSMPLIMALHPVIINSFKKNKDYWKIIDKAVFLISIVFGGFSYLLYSYGFKVIEFYTNINYSPVKIPLITTYFGLYISACLIYYQKGLEVKMKTLLLAKIFCTISILSIILTYILIKMGGLIFGAIIFVLAQGLCALILLGIEDKILYFGKHFSVYFLSYILIYYSDIFIIKFIEENSSIHLISIIVVYFFIIILSSINIVNKIEFNIK